MPRIALVCLCLVGACRFDADYAGGGYRCSDNICPDPLVCEVDVNGDKVCRERSMDAAIDTPRDMMIDARPAALTCADPGILAPTGDTDTNTTAGKVNKVMPSCNGSMMLAADAVYKIEPLVGKQMLVDVSPMNANFAVAAYVTTMCPSSACLTNTYAYANNPINVTTLSGPHYIIVDSTLSGQSGQYTLTVDVN